MKLKHIVASVLIIITFSFIYIFSKNYFAENIRQDDFLTNEIETAEIEITEEPFKELFAHEYNIYTNNICGYEIALPQFLTLNEDIISIKSRFESDELVIDIFYDNFTGTIDSSSTYEGYGNKGIKENSDFKITKEYEDNLFEIKTHVTFYEREKLSKNLNDRNYYATVEFEKNNYEVVTVFIKSSIPMELNDVIHNFKFIEKSGGVGVNKIFKPIKKCFGSLTQQFYDTHFVNNEMLSFGIFEPSFPFYDEKLKELEKMYDYNFPVVLLYNSFALPYKKEQMDNAKKHNKVVEFTLYTTDKINGSEKDITLDILEGKYDDYLKTLASNFIEYDYPVLFRLNNEMNGGWVKYSAFHVGKDTDLYKDCWIYIYDTFKNYGVNNLIFVWNPNERTFPGFSYNHYANYYPGDEYVDIVGLTAYNTGNYYEGETWRSFEEAYDHFYYEYKNQFEHPFMITEFSCAAEGGDKVSWFDDMFCKISCYDRIKMAVLWNGQDFDMTKQEKTISRNYRLDLDKNVIEAIRKGLEIYKTKP